MDSNAWTEIDLSKAVDGTYAQPAAVQQHNAIPWLKAGSVVVFGGLDSATGTLGDTATPWILETAGVCPGQCLNGGNKIEGTTSEFAW